MDGFFSFLSTVFYLALVLAAVAAFIAFRSYNSLQAMAQAIKERASNTQVAISKKLSLVNQLIDVVKSFQEAEQFTHLKISADSAGAMATAYQQSGSVLASIQGMAERFPELKSSQQYHRLIDSIQACEDDIQKRRTGYNEVVRVYNTARLSIPTVFVARFLGFGDAPYLEFDHSGIDQVTTLKEFKTDDGERLQQLIAGAGSRIAQTSKGLLQHTADAGRAFQERMRDGDGQAKASQTQAATDVYPTQMPAQYFYMEPEGVPAGPETLARIHAMQQQGVLSGSLRIAQVGTQNWIPVPGMAIETATGA